MYEDLISLIEKYDADISEIGLKYQYNDHVDYVIIGNTGALSRDKAMCGFLDRSINIQGCVCGKLYKSEIAKKLRFPLGRLHEDGYYTYRAIYETEKYVIGDKCLYNYRQNREGSIMTTQTKDNPQSLFDVLNAFEERNAFFQMKRESVFEEKSKAYYFKTLISYIRKFENVEDDKTRIVIANKINKNFGNIINNTELSFLWKIKFIIYRVLKYKLFKERCSE